VHSTPSFINELKIRKHKPPTPGGWWLEEALLCPGYIYIYIEREREREREREKYRRTKECNLSFDAFSTFTSIPYQGWSGTEFHSNPGSSQLT
jgi:hypothetical protein